MSLFGELKRRNVFRVATAYLAGAWLLIEVADTIFPYVNLVETAVRILIVVLAIGFPVTVLLTWVFELTPEGVKLQKDVDRTAPIPRTSTRRLDRAIIVLLVLALGYFAFDKFVLEPARVVEIVEETAQQARSEALVESYGDKSIAVLPFVNMSADSAQEFFSDGISEELLNLLARVPSLRVTARTSSFSYKGKDIKIADVARDLNVGHVLEGSVRKSGNRVRITAQLIEARSDTHLWSETYDRDLIDIFAIQDEVAAAIVSELKVELAIVTGERGLPHSIKATNSAAYEAYLQGRDLINQRGRANTMAAAGHLERALRLDANYAPAHAQLGIALILYVGYNSEERQAAIEHFDRALELVPDLAEAHAGRAMLEIHEGKYKSAIANAKKALDQNPNYIDAMNWLAIALGYLGRDEEAEGILDQMVVIDPMSVVGRSTQALWLISQGRAAEAHEIADQLLEQSQWAGHNVHIQAYLWWSGEHAKGLSWALRTPGTQYDVMAAFQFVGAFSEARRIKNPYYFWADVEQRSWDTAAQAALNKLQQSPDNGSEIAFAAKVLYFAGRFDEAQPLYERLLDMAPEGELLPVSWLPLVQTMRFALVRRESGDEEGAQNLVRIVREKHANDRVAGGKSWRLDLAEAMIAAFDHDDDHVITALKSAIHNGLPTRVYIYEPFFEGMQDKPGFVALRQEMEVKFAAEHDKVLQLICFNNPVPDDWQPLPETCEGVKERPES